MRREIRDEEGYTKRAGGREASRGPKQLRHLYLAYALDPNGSAFSVRILDANDDASAYDMAARIPSLHGIEVWDCSRLLKRLPGKIAVGW